MAFARACPFSALATDLRTIAVVVRYFFDGGVVRIFYALVLLMGMRRGE
jgi:hypothetical protein